jgi:hypothetical protein
MPRGLEGRQARNQALTIPQPQLRFQRRKLDRMNRPQGGDRLRVMAGKSKLSVEWLTFYVAMATLAVALVTLVYMLHHDEKADWADVHKSMTEVLAAQKSAVARKSAMGAYGPGPNAFDERRIQFEAAVALLRGQLNRVGSDPLAVGIGTLLDANRDTGQWMSDTFVKNFEERAAEVAERTR